MKLAAVLVLAVSACSAAPSGSPALTSASPVAASPVQSPTAPPAPPGKPPAYAVIVKDFLEGGSTYSVSVVGTDGRVAAAAHPRKRSQFVQIGNLSTSMTTLYYLDGDSDIRFLRPDGTTGSATNVALGTHQVAVFAVSPDDRRIAVSVLDYTKYPVSTRLYAEDLTGHGNHVELFTSQTVLEWPAGWHNGRLVVALGLNARPQNAWEGFVRGYGYHVADAQTGNRFLSLCDGGASYVPESSAGTVCVQYPKVTVVTWDGAVWDAPKDGTCPMWGPLSASGLMANRRTTTPNGGCRSNADAFLVTGNGQAVPQAGLPRQADPEGWIDGGHIVFVSDTAPSSSSIVDITTGTVTPIVNAPGFFAAALPGAL